LSRASSGDGAGEGGGEGDIAGVGGVTALASKKSYPVYLDETATLFEQITVSAGMRGVLLCNSSLLRIDALFLLPRITTIAIP
jgi:predicted ATP-grasp superfamily ATP-dependent carboligase